MTYKITTEQAISIMYTNRKASLIRSIFLSLTNLSKIDELTALIGTYMDNINRRIDPEDRDAVEGIIVKYCLEDVIIGEYGVIIELNTDVSIEFIDGVLQFFIGLTNYDPILTVTVSDILADDDTSKIGKLGEVVTLYQPEFYELDVHNIVHEIPDIIYKRYVRMIKDSIERQAFDNESAAEFTTRLSTLCSDFTTTSLYKYIIINNKFDITDASALAVIDQRIKSSIATDAVLSKELLVYSVIAGKSITEMVELIDTIYPDRNTKSIIKYLRLHEVS